MWGVTVDGDKWSFKDGGWDGCNVGDSVESSDTNSHIATCVDGIYVKVDDSAFVNEACPVKFTVFANGYV